MKRLITIFVWVLGLVAFSAYAQDDNLMGLSGVTLDRTRVVISNGAHDGSLGVSNLTKGEILVNTIIENVDGSEASAFLATPQVYRLAPGRTSRMRLVQTEDLPQDRESVFWVKVMCIPAAGISDRDKNQMAYVITQKVKLFYRPKSVTGNTTMAAQSLVWSWEKGKLVAQNPSNVSVSMPMLIAGKKLKKVDALILPGQKAAFDFKKSSSMKFTFVDEYGGVKQEEIKFGR